MGVCLKQILLEIRIQYVKVLEIRVQKAGDRTFHRSCVEYHTSLTTWEMRCVKQTPLSKILTFALLRLPFFRPVGVT